MSFRLTTILWVFALVAAALSAFGTVGIGVAAIVLFAWATALSNVEPLGWKWRVFKFLFVLLVCGLLAAILNPFAARSPFASRQNSCRSQAQQIATALLTYASKQGSFPPPFTTDAEGRRLHGWRVLLLPYLDEMPLYEKIRLDEPWDSSHNQQFATQIPEVYRCPGAVHCSEQRHNPFPQRSPGATNYFAIVGPATIWPEDGGIRFRDITDGLSKTVIVIESAEKDVNWMEPVDLSFDEAVKLVTSPNSLRHLDSGGGYFRQSFFHGSGSFVFANGRVDSCGDIDSRKLAKAIFTRATGDEEYQRTMLPNSENSVYVTDYRTIYAFTLFVLIALMPGVLPVWRRIGPGRTDEA